MAKLEYKLEIKGKITVLTGLHIGGSDVDLTIGGIDSEVAKNRSDGAPYIPGSTLSGKLRNLIARSLGYKYLNFKAAAREALSRNWDRSYTALLFSGRGFNADCTSNNQTGRLQDNSNNFIQLNGQRIELAPYTRLLIRDSFLITPFDDKTLEDKAENTINRNTGEANPRHIERVVRGSEFELDMTLDIYEHDNSIKLLETLHLGINLLNNDYLGGMGSRGSGTVKVTVDQIEKLSFIDGNIVRENYTGYSFNPLNHENSPNPPSA